MTTKNGNLPAMPIELNGFGQFAPEAHIGLTKREMFAMAAMQGILANQCMVDDCSRSSLEWAAKRCASMADALLAELEESK